MATKDYYQILNVSPAASIQEIRKAFRQLALRYHPDRNHADPLAAVHFREIQEAYHTLSDKGRRSAWHYEHYYSLHKAARTGMVTPDWILTQSLELQKKLSRQNQFLYDRDLLHLQIKELLSPYHLSVLQHANDIATNSAIIQQLLSCLPLLSYQQAIETVESLSAIRPVHAATETSIKVRFKARKRQWIIDRYRIPAAILLALLLLAVIVISIR
ncbi:J domain-containing protein [Filimonas effusa]|uniref:J domain-containing protein n=1 Tax=Filimonas effusa TaxID=2508721 RepID=A0A4V1MAE2_9BACT|nr:DnaJ domain-containing protein [Filimonas effusa]RXK85566.1 J domain-containing protein [Filimonas effusa]